MFRVYWIANLELLPKSPVQRVWKKIREIRRILRHMTQEELYIQKVTAISNDRQRMLNKMALELTSRNAAKQAKFVAKKILKNYYNKIRAQKAEKHQIEDAKIRDIIALATQQMSKSPKCQVCLLALSIYEETPKKAKLLVHPDKHRCNWQVETWFIINRDIQQEVTQQLLLTNAISADFFFGYVSLKWLRNQKMPLQVLDVGTLHQVDKVDEWRERGYGLYDPNHPLTTYKLPLEFGPTVCPKQSGWNRLSTTTIWHTTPIEAWSFDSDNCICCRTIQTVNVNAIKQALLIEHDREKQRLLLSLGQEVVVDHVAMPTFSNRQLKKDRDRHAQSKKKNKTQMKR